MPRVHPTTNGAGGGTSASTEKKIFRNIGEQMRWQRLPELARCPNIGQQIEYDIAAMGLIGEKANGALVYRGYCSRVLEKPLAIIARGPSGSGKDTVLKRPAKLFPPEHKIMLLSGTDASWFNDPDVNRFVHKVVISGERKHSQKPEVRDANAMLRQLISEGRIDRRKSVFDPETQDWTTVHQTCYGPIAYAETTTAGSIFDEDLNRRVEIWVDDSEEQNRKVMESVAVRYAPNRPKVDEDAIIKRHHEFQEYLQKLTIPLIVIPYYWVLPKLIPAEKPKCRRVIEQVFAMVEVEVLLHLHERQVNNDGAVVATLADYAEARRMLIVPINASLGVGPMHQDAQRLKEKFPTGGFDTTAVREKLGLYPVQASRMLNRLREANIINCLSPGRSHTPAVWEWVEEKLPEVDRIVLPTVEQVAAKMMKRSRVESA